MYNFSLIRLVGFDICLNTFQTNVKFDDVTLTKSGTNSYEMSKMLEKIHTNSYESDILERCDQQDIWTRAPGHSHPQYCPSPNIGAGMGTEITNARYVIIPSNNIGIRWNGRQMITLERSPNDLFHWSSIASSEI